MYFRMFRSPFVPHHLGVGFCSTEREWAKLLSYQLSILLVTGESRCPDPVSWTGAEVFWRPAESRTELSKCFGPFLKNTLAILEKFSLP